MESHSQIEDRAAAFLAQRDSGEWIDANQAELEAWLSESTARRVGFLRLEAVWDDARRLKALSAGLSSEAVPSAGEWRHSPFFNTGSNSSSSLGDVAIDLTSSVPAQSSRERDTYGRLRLRQFAVAAAVIVAVGIGAYFASTPKGDRYGTPIGGIASIPLRDGSNITLNTATEVRVELTPRERHIRLDEGEAFFEVAHDPTRPFIVQVEHTRVIAVGTKFSVRRNGADIRVVVTEGEVRLQTRENQSNRVAAAHDKQGATGRTTETARAGGLGEVFLKPGSIASASDAGIVVEQRPLMEAQDDLSWRQGYLTFHETSLADAVAEFNRYNTHKIFIEDPTVAGIRISGTFRALNYEGFVRVLNDGFAIHSRSSEHTTTITR